MSPKTNKRRKSPNKKKKSTPKSAMLSFRGAVQIFGISMIFGTILFSLTLGVERVGKFPVFKINKIRWAGLKHLKEKDMKEHFKSIFGKNIFQVDINEIHRRLLANQWIKSATVKKEYPDELLIVVVEQKPASVEYNSGNKIGEWVNFSTDPTLLDQEGNTLQQGGPFPPNLPQLINVSQASYTEALSFGHLLKYRSGAYIDLSDPNDMLVYFTDPQKKTPIGQLHLGLGQYQEKWLRFLNIEADLTKRGFPYWEVDFRFLAQAVVKFGPSKSKRETLYF